MGKRYLIDTNVIIYLSADKIPEKGKEFVIKIIDEQPEISVITKIELLGFKNVPEVITEFTKIAKNYSVDNEIVEQTIRLRKEYKIKLPDAIIAATAINYNLTLITRNEKDFEKISEVKVINPFEI
ncbi:MAG: type II toxin-antitoxin system VapC family toxin [Bacteroidales bacterium]|nr:type II toxin-antitoxin system VapC family toxin [Bacteroidales bacterium]